MGQTARKEAVCPGGNTDSTPPSTHAFFSCAPRSNTPPKAFSRTNIPSTHTFLFRVHNTPAGGREGGERADRGHQKREREALLSRHPPSTHTAPPSTLTAPRALQGRAEESRALEKHPAPSPMPRFFLLPSHRSSRLASSRIQPLPPFLLHTPSSPDTIGRPPSRGPFSAAVSDAGSALHPTGTDGVDETESDPAGVEPTTASQQIAPGARCRARRRQERVLKTNRRERERG